MGIFKKQNTTLYEKHSKITYKNDGTKLLLLVISFQDCKCDTYHSN